MVNFVPEHGLYAKNFIYSMHESEIISYEHALFLLALLAEWHTNCETITYRSAWEQSSIGFHGPAKYMITMKNRTWENHNNASHNLADRKYTLKLLHTIRSLRFDPSCTHIRIPSKKDFIQTLCRKINVEKEKSRIENFLSNYVTICNLKLQKAHGKMKIGIS